MTAPKPKSERHLRRLVREAAGLDDKATIRNLRDQLVDAYNEIRRRLLRRGASSEQVDAWDCRQEIARDLALWKALTLGGALEGFDKKFIDDFCNSFIDSSS